VYKCYKENLYANFIATVAMVIVTTNMKIFIGINQSCRPSKTSRRW